jgi:hypothetical protein
MGQLDKKLANVRKYKNFPRVLNGIIKDNEKEILALNRDQMWEDGIIDVNNPRNILSYAPSTVKQKKRRAKFKRTDHITLRDQGTFYEKMKLKIEPDQFTITSTDPKWTRFSSGDWGQGRFQNALGLTEDSLNELRKLIVSDLIIGFKDAVQNT